MYKFLFLFFSLSAVALTYKYLQRVHYNQEIVSRVTLKTNCEIELKSFAIQNLESGEIREFQHGEAFIKATLADRLKIVLSEEFKEVSFEGEEFSPEPKVEIFQDCKKPVGIDGVFDSFNKQFSSK